MRSSPSRRRRSSTADSLPMGQKRLVHGRRHWLDGRVVASRPDRSVRRRRPEPSILGPVVNVVAVVDHWRVVAADRGQQRCTPCCVVAGSGGQHRRTRRPLSCCCFRHRSTTVHSNECCVVAGSGGQHRRTRRPLSCCCFRHRSTTVHSNECCVVAGSDGQHRCIPDPP